MLKPALVVMSRMPSKEGKSRLSSVLSPDQREALQWAFLEDTLDKIRLLREFECYLAITPSIEIKILDRFVRFAGQVIPQPVGDLGKRMLGIAEQLFLNGHTRVILIGTDVPSLPPSYFIKALNILDQSDFVFGPALDGGYYLIGMRHFDGSIFNDISWGSEMVLDETLKICHKNKFTYKLLDSLMDIDRPEDLQALLEQYENNKIAFMPTPARTINFLKSLPDLG